MRILFMGRKQVAADSLQWLLDEGHTVVGVLTDSHLEGSPTARLAREWGLQMLTLEEARYSIGAATLEFDLGVSVVYWRIVPADVIGAATRGIINFHPAPLPDYKGTAGYNIAILRGLDEWAVTAHYMNSGVDTGPIIERANFLIDPDRETTVSLERLSMERMRAQFRRVITQATTADTLLPTTPNEGGEYISRREMEAMKAVNPGDDIDRKIRAFWFPPYSGASVILEGRRYTLVNEHILESLSCQGTHMLSPSTRSASSS